MTVSRAKWELGDQAVLFTCLRLFPGEQVEVRIKPWGVSKPVCLEDLSFTSCSLSPKPIASAHLTSQLFLFFQCGHHSSLRCGFCCLPTVSVQVFSVFFTFLQCGRKVWSSTKAAIRWFRMFLSHPFLLSTFLIFVIRVFALESVPSVTGWDHALDGSLSQDTHFHSYTHNLQPTCSCFWIVGGNRSALKTSSAWI